MPPRYARVAVALPLRDTYHYLIPERLESLVRPGVRCVVEFGRRRVSGFVLSLDETPDIDPKKIKPLAEIVEPEPCLPSELVELARWISGYYHHPLGETLNAMLPPALRTESRVEYVAVQAARDGNKLSEKALALFARIVAAGTLPGARLPRGSGPALDALLKAGYVERRWNVQPRSRPPVAQWCRKTGQAPAPGSLGANRVKLALLLSLLDEGPLPFDAVRGRGVGRDTVKRAQANGWVELSEADVSAAGVEGWGLGDDDAVVPTPAQAHCLERIEACLAERSFQPLLLRGVTGSGKTEVYVRAVAQTLARGRSALVLAPEIALTPQLVGRFAARLGGALAVLHSGLSEKERGMQWRRVRNGEARVVVGTRSAVFAPLENLGLIVIDEEHDAGYKQEEGLRYHAKHVALMRGREAGAPVLLGSATPDVESHAAALAGRYEPLLLPARVAGARPPEVRLLDIRQEEARTRGQVLISEPLARAVDQALEREEQALFFLNRRGFAPALYCPECAEPLACRHCSVPLTLHRKRGGSGRLVCHYCGVNAPAPRVCPVCGMSELVELGAGTQKLEAQIAVRWPEAGVVRLDRDAASGVGGLETLSAFSRGRADILVGTQMVAKGHHFPRLTVVGVVAADEALHLPDFRSTERAYQTLTQVAGRAGRGEQPGTVYIQTRNPHHPVLREVAEGDYEGFAAKELEERAQAGFPPARRLALVGVSAPTEPAAREAIHAAAQALRAWAPEEGVELLGPAPAPLERLRGHHRFQLLLRGPGPEPGPLQRVLRRFAVSPAGAPSPPARLRIDVDPVWLL